MKDHERSQASKEQIQCFFSAYYSNWRFAKILMNEKILNERYSFLPDVVGEIEEAGIAGEGLIAQELKNGLLFDIIANCVQYIEDLFALINAGKRVDFFIKDVVTYKAGSIDTLIRKEFKRDEIRKLFFVPKIDGSSDAEYEKVYSDGLSKLESLVSDIQEFYKRYYFFYIQYKHGLTVAMRPFQPFDQNQIELDKSGKMETSLYAIDNLSISKIYGDQYRHGLAILMPFITPNIQPHIDALQKEDNLIRYLLSPQGTSVKNVKQCAVKIKHCIELFRHNILETLAGKEAYEIYLPHDLKQILKLNFSDIKKNN